MQGEHRDRIKSLFRAAIDLPPAKRRAFCSAQCEDESMLAELWQLIGSHSNESDFLKSPIEAAGPAAIDDPFIGKQIDSFQICRRIGAGGMGVVYEAVQENPKRKAAIKLLQPGRSSQKMLWRFQHESEILARLQHPGVAHIYASGITNLGHGDQPWFAMELIDGLPLHHYLSEHALSIAQKLQLLMGVCDAVQHAHERGVIHRDLKPANIVISVEAATDGGSVLNGQPKVLDFGVARVVEESGDPNATMQTEFGEIVGTVSYMSPERFSSDPAHVDQRCDVYALGVIGYEMLAGELPIDARSNNITDSIRAVEQIPPQRLGKLVPSLRGDLEVIFAKALEKDPARRYHSAREFSDDIRRYLQSEPIRARPASVTYRVRKFVSRNRTLVGGTLATITALSFGMVMYAKEAQKARTEAKRSQFEAGRAELAAERSQYEADKATAINNFIANDFFTKLIAAAQTGQSNQRLPVAELMDEAAANITAMFGDQPKIEAAVRNEVGTIYYNVAVFKRANQEFQRALVLWESELGPEHPDTLKAVNNLGLTLMHLNRSDEAESLYRRALTGRLNVLGEADSHTLATMNNLAELLRGSARLDEAEELLKRAYHLQLEAVGPDDKLTLTLMANLGSLLAQRKNYKEAVKLHRTAYATLRKTLGKNHITALHAGSRLSQTLHRLGDYEEAKEILIPVIESVEQIHGGSHIDAIIVRRLMARIERDLGDPIAAKKQLMVALEAANNQPEKFASSIRRIEREIEALDRESE